MKRNLFFLCCLLIAALLLGCAGNAVVEQPAAPTAASEEEPESLVTVPPQTADPFLSRTEWIVSAQEGFPDLETLSRMQSLQYLDLSAFADTPLSAVEAISAALPDCRIVWNQRLTDGIFCSEAEALTLPNATESDIESLAAFRALHTLDASGSTAYDALAAFREARPDVAVHYTLTLGPEKIDESTVSLIVPFGIDPNDLKTALSAFPILAEIDLRESGWDEEEIAAFLQEYQTITVHRFIGIGTQTFDCDVDSLDLHAAEDLGTDRLIETLSAFHKLKTIALPPETSEEDLDALRNAFPEIQIVGPVAAFDRSFSGYEKEIDLSNIEMTETEPVEALVQKLPFLKKVVMCRCGLSNEQMETLCNAHPDIKFVWTVTIGKREVRTDAIGFSTLNPTRHNQAAMSDPKSNSINSAVRLYEGDIKDLKYCTDLQALDLGHNYITNSDLEVIAGLTKLKVLILADNEITDISALTTLKDLEYIELFMNKIPDMSPLTEMPSLIDVNICNTGVSDLTPLFELTSVRRLWFAMNPFDKQQAKAVKEALPDCNCNYTLVFDETSEGWREDQRYRWMRSYFV